MKIPALPDRVRWVRIKIPLTYTKLIGEEAREFVVDAATLPTQFEDFEAWPALSLETTGYRWRAFSLLGFSLVFMWARSKFTA